METLAEGRAEIIALAILPSAVRGREIGGGGITYRRALPGIVPGQRLTLAVERRWRFRRTEMVGGPLLHVGFSLRALQRAGFELPTLTPTGLRVPGERDDRLREGLMAIETGQWTTGRCLLLEALEDQPACLVAHAAMGRLLAGLEHREHAMQHLTAAIRLGLGACADAAATTLDATREPERALLDALVVRSQLLAALGREEDAAADLRRALAWDPADRADARGAGRGFSTGSAMAAAGTP